MRGVIRRGWRGEWAAGGSFHIIHRHKTSIIFPRFLKRSLFFQITGAGHGIGRETALRFAKLGGIIVCVDINAKGNQETVDIIREQKGKAHRYE